MITEKGIMERIEYAIKKTRKETIEEIEKIILEDKKIKEFHNLLLKIDELKSKEIKNG